MRHQELHIERASAHGLVGTSTWPGGRVLPGMQSAFIDVGGERAAFLHVADIWGHRHGGEASVPIEKVLAEGQSLMVQVIKDPIGTKGARLSTQIGIAGRFLVYLPQESHIGISQRIEDEENASTCAKGWQFAAAARRAWRIHNTQRAEAASERRAQFGPRLSSKLWRASREVADGAGADRALPGARSEPAVLRISFMTGSRIVVDSRETSRMAGFAGEFTAAVAGRIESTRARPAVPISTEWTTRSKRPWRGAWELKVGRLPDPRPDRGVDTIDVNTGGFVGARSFDDTSSRPTSRRRR